MAANRSVGCILLTGFEPFGGEALNPSWLVAQALHGRSVAGAAAQPAARVEALQLPCVFGAAADGLLAALRRHRPAAVLCLGQAGGRSGFTLERIAINVDDARIADNAGRQPIDQPVVAGGAAAYFSRLPIKALVAALQAAGHPAAVSQTAGTYVCNHVFYALMHALRRRPGVSAGFLHLPWLPQQHGALSGQPCLALEQQIAGVELLLQLLWHRPAERVLAGGAEH